MPGRLQDKIAIITGASGGIGRAIALAYHAEGARIVCADIQPTGRKNEPGLTHELITSEGGSAIYVPCDVGIASQVESLVAKAVEWGGRLDVMVNNAGVVPTGGKSEPVWELSVENWERVNLINSTGVFYGVKFASRQMVQQAPHASGDRGWIINMSSVLGLRGAEGTAAYCASKHAVLGLTKSAALACGPKRIHVNAICPGFSETAMTQQLFDSPEIKQALIGGHGFGDRLGEPEDVARACVFLASADARWVTGVGLPVDGGFSCR